MCANTPDDAVAARALAVLELATFYDKVGDAAVRERMLMTLDLLNESINNAIYPNGRKGPTAPTPRKSVWD